MEKQNFKQLMQKFASSQDVNKLKNNMKSTAKSFAKDAKKIAGSKEVQDLKTAGLETLQKGANNMLNKIFDSSLDGMGTDEFLKIIRFVIKYANVFVISHKADLHDKFNSVIRFEKVKGFSRVVS